MHGKERFKISTIDRKDETLADVPLSDIAMVRLQRRKIESNTFKTVLISVLNDKHELKIALRWAAEIRRGLLDPETADLYMLISIPSLSDQECMNIESREEFCRKFVLRHNESLDELMARTFITRLTEEGNSDEISDPLSEALRKTGNDFPWFDKEKQEHWKKRLLSGLTSAELIEQLFTDTMENQSND